MRGTGRWLGGLMEYLEYTVHRVIRGLGNAANLIGTMVLPTRQLEEARRKRARRREEKGDNDSPNALTTASETFEYYTYVTLDRIGQFFGYLLKIFVPAALLKKTERAVAEKSSTVWFNVARRVDDLGKRFAPKWLYKLSQRTYHLFQDIGSFVGIWLRTRRYRQLMYAIPAMVLLLPVAAASVYSLTYTDVDRVRHYQRALQTAIDDENMDRQQLCIQKLSQLGFQRIEEAEFQSAIALAEDESTRDEAIERIRALAPEDVAGFAPAHFWMAEQLLLGKLSQPEPWKAVEHHANQVIELASGRYRGMKSSAMLMQVEVDLHFGREEEAISRMQELASRYPAINVQLMELHVKRNETAAAQKLASRVDLYCASALKKATQSKDAVNDSAEAEATDPPSRREQLNPDFFKSWSMALGLMGDKTRQLERIKTGHEMFPEDQELQNGLLALLKTKLAKTPTSSTNMAELMVGILRIEPDDPVVIAMLARGILKKDANIFDHMSELRKSGLLPSRAFMLVGDQYFRNGQFGDAISSYQNAIDVDPQAHRAWNNIAWIQGNVEPLALQAAIESINRAIALNPEGRYFETRGQIYLKTQQWRLAIEDLERALNGAVPNAGEVHLSMAKAYDMLGEPALAQAHRSQSN